MTTAEPRIHPRVEVSRGDIEQLLGGAVIAVPITKLEPLLGGFTNTLHRVTLASGEVLVVKHFATKEAFRDESAALAQLATVLPVPEVIATDRAKRAIVYRWIDGATLEACQREQSPTAFESIAEPLGRFLAWMAHTEPVAPGPPRAGYPAGSGQFGEAWDPARVVADATARLQRGRARERMGDPLANAMLRAFELGGEAAQWGAPCLAHHDLSARNILVQPAAPDRWRLLAVIDWEGAGVGSPFIDIGSLFRDADRFSPAFRVAFARGFREGGAELPDDWHRAARLLDAVRIVELLADPRELPGVFADCRRQLTRLAKEYIGE